MNDVLLIILIVLAAALLLYILSGWLVFYFICHRKSRLASKIISKSCEKAFKPYETEITKGRAELAACPKKDVEILSYDGLKLHASFIEGKSTDRTIICVHGYRSNPIHDFSLAIFDLLNDGNVLMIDQRAHGKSEGKYISLGVHEGHDVKSWAKYLYKEFGKDHAVFLDGVSMGGATVLMAGGLNLPENVKGIIADCPFSSTYGIVASMLKGVFGFVPHPILFCTDIFCRIFAKFSLRKSGGINEVNKHSIPMVFAHGKKDVIVPYQMSVDAYDAFKGKKYLVLSETADHGLTFLTDYEEYKAVLKEFFNGD